MARVLGPDILRENWPENPLNINLSGKIDMIINGYLKKMKHESINFGNKFSKFSEHWSPKVIAEMNDYHFKLVKIKGDFVWRDHKDTDEVFIDTIKNIFKKT